VENLWEGRDTESVKNHSQEKRGGGAGRDLLENRERGAREGDSLKSEACSSLLTYHEAGQGSLKDYDMRGSRMD